MSLGTAFKAFFKILGDAELAGRVRQLLDGSAAEAPAEPGTVTQKRSEALTLLSALQREGRLVDFVMEPLDGYSDAQVGAAARDVHRDCGAVIQRLFGPEALNGQSEGSSVEVPAGYDPAAWRLTGSPAGDGAQRGTLQHPGWKAARCEVPSWTGAPDSARVLAPAEVEVEVG